MGRTKKPLEQRILEAKGDGRDARGKKIQVVQVDSRFIQEKPNREVPALPVGVKGRGVVEWTQIWQSAPWLHPTQDYHFVEQICRAYADMAEFRQAIEEQGLYVKGYAGQITANPLISEVRKCEETIRTCLSKLGMSPTDRARLGVTEAKARNAVMDLKHRVNDHKGIEK